MKFYKFFGLLLLLDFGNAGSRKEAKRGNSEKWKLRKSAKKQQKKIRREKGVFFIFFMKNLLSAFY